MGTKEEKLEKYRNLWVLFEELLKKEGLNIKKFAKKWEKYHDEEDSDYEKFLSRVKKQQHQFKVGKSVPQSKTISQIEEYIKFLDNKIIFFEVFDDEKFGNLF